MKKILVLLVGILFLMVFLFSNKDMDNYKFVVNNFTENDKLNSDFVEDSYTENSNLKKRSTYYNNNKNTSYPIKVLVLEYALSNTSFGNNSEINLSILNGDEYSYNLVPYKEDEIINSPYGAMTYLESEIAFYRHIYNSNMSYLEYEDLFTPSLRSVEKFFDNEYERITGEKKDIVDLKVMGPFEITSKIEAGLGNNSEIRGEEFKEYFENLSIEKGINLTSYDVVVYILFDDFRYHHKKFFRSFADPINSKVYVNFLADRYYDGINTVIHELIHVLGGEDKYIDKTINLGKGNLSNHCRDDGIANVPDSVLHTQNKECVMCGYMPINKTKSFSSNYLSQIMICDKTAKEIGWLQND